MISLSANEIAGYSFIGWSFNGNISENNLQKITKVRGFSPADYMAPPGTTSTIAAVYKNNSSNELKIDNITINWK